MKIVMTFLILLFVSCAIHSTDKQNNDKNDERFPKNSLMIESMKLSSDITSNLNDIELSDSLSIIQKTDLSYLKSMINPAKPTILYFWTSMSKTPPDFDLWESLLENKKFDVFIIATDVCTSSQIKLLRKYLLNNNITKKTYIIYNNYGSVKNIIKEAKTFNHTSKFINSIDKKSKEFQLPYGVVLKNNMIIDRIQNLNNYNFKKEISSNSKGIESFSNISKNNTNDKQKRKELVFPSQLTINYLNDSIHIPEKYKLQTLNTSKMKNILNNKNKKLIYVWGSWCPTTSLGINNIKKLMPDSDDDYRLMLISADMQTDGQTELIERFLYNNHMSNDSFIIENQFNNIDDLKEFQKFKHVINFINSFDSTYSKIALPYLAVLDEDNKIVYKKALEIDKDALQIEKKSVAKEYFNEFKILKVDKIRKILNE